jgi:tetratricopeptide (TPR) repeat protein
VPGYDLSALLGAGGFAAVFAARRLTDGAQVAVKVGHNSDALTRARFRREADALEHIGPPHVPAHYESGTLGDGRPYISMERLEGETLADFLCDRDGPASAPDLERWLVPLLDALAAAHQAGFVHRDLKPENVFLRASGSPCLMDFGLARGADHGELTRTGAVLGTAEYMSPEQLRGTELDASSDVYAFGVILYELVTQRPPFVGDPAEVTYGHLMLRPPRPSDLAPVPDALEELILACLEKSPDRRPRTVRQLHAALRRALEAASREPAAPPRPAVRPSARTAIRTEGRRPVVLLCTESDAATGYIAEVASTHRGIVARHRRGRLMLAFSGAHGDNPVRRAVSAGAEMLAGAPDARAAIHLVALRVRSGKDSIGVYGREVERPETWIPPSESWSGLVLTDSAARALDDNTLLEPSSPGFFAVHRAPTDEGDQEQRAAFVGREREIDAARASISGALEGAGPALLTVTGSPGIGKSRLAAEVAAWLRARHPKVRVFELRSRRPMASDAEQTLRQLLRAVLNISDRSTPDDPRAWCEGQLGSDLGGATWQGVAAVLGWQEAPGAAARRLRAEALRAIGRGLRRLAGRRPLALLLDDAHWTDATTLAALELATLESDAPLPLWVGVFADPRLEQLNKSWGSRTSHHDRVQLAPLDESAARLLAVELLHPVQNPPRAVTERLASWSGGNPQKLVEIVRALEREKIVRTYPNSDEWYVATDGLAHLPASPTLQWLAARELDALPRDLANLVRSCAVLGTELTLDELEHVQRSLQRDGSWAHRLVDAAVGLTQLTERGILVAEGGDRYAFREPAFREACYALVEPAARETLHAHAYQYWRSLPADATADRLYRLAHHAAHGGYEAQAQSLALALATSARRRHAYAEAEVLYTNALELMGSEASPAQLRALYERGGVRRNLTHYEAAQSDFRAALAIAEQLDDRVATVELLTAQAAVHDFKQEYGESVRLVERARELAPTGLPPEAEARLLNWLGVARCRQQRHEEAAELLGLAEALGNAVGDHETEVGSLLMLAPALRETRGVDEGLAVLDQAIDKCERAGDDWHLAVGLSNRVNFWRDKKDHRRAVLDAERAMQIAGEMGFGWIETIGYINLAELQLWSGDSAAALEAASRSYRRNIARFREEPFVIVNLYYAHLLCHEGRFDQARRVLESTRQDEVEDPTVALILRCAQVATTDADPRRWDELVEEARRQVPGEQLVEILWLRGRCALRSGDWTGAEQALAVALTEADRAGSLMAQSIGAELELAKRRQPLSAPSSPGDLPARAPLG